MPDPTVNSTSPSEPGRHYEFIKSKLPQWLVEAKPEQRAELKKTRARMPAWYASSSPAQKNLISQLQQARFASQGVLNDAVKRIQSVEAFAQPLLEAALKQKGFELSVNEVYMHLYVRDTDAFGVSTNGFSSKFLSLLQATLHNFEVAETAPGYYLEYSGFITKPASDGTYKAYTTSLKLEEFTQLCRDLDIGAKYQAYLNSSSGVPEHPLRDQYVIHQKDALKLDAQIALLRGHINEQTHALLMRVVAGERNIWSGQLKLWYRRLAVMKLDLKGCVVFDLSTYLGFAQSVIVWIPGDPEHPLKQYESFYDFREEFVGKLTAGAGLKLDIQLTPYQQFISGFIAQKDRPLYYQNLTKLRKDRPELPWGMEWFRSGKTQFWVRALAPLQTSFIAVPSNPDVHVSRIPKEHLFLEVDMFVMRGFGLWDDVDLWDRMFIEMRDGIFANARAMAVSTADTDANTVSIRLSHYLNFGMSVINVLAMAVPVLGEIMMMVMAAQMLYETIEGCIEWAAGDTETAWNHISDVLENIAMLAGGAVVFHVGVTPVIEKLKVVTLPGGLQKLWKPDLTPYEHPVTVPSHSVPDTAGLHILDDKVILPHEGKRYALKEDPITDDYRVQHPSREDAYEPVFRHNGHGVWVHEGESPLTWDRATLIRRLGPSVEGLSDVEIEQVLKVSEIGENQLRRMYVENEPIPPLLQDNIDQFKAYSNVMKAIREVKAGSLSEDLNSLAVSLMTEMPGWPQSKAIAVVDSVKLHKIMARYGNPHALARDVISIKSADVMGGKLPGHVVDELSVRELKGMLGENMPADREGREILLKQRLIDHMEENTSRLYHSLYETQLTGDDPAALSAVELVQRVFPTLPRSLAGRLVNTAPKAEFAQLKLGKIPLRMMKEARILQRGVRLSSAYRGLYLESVITTDTETLALNTLEKLPGWSNGLRIEVRNENFHGELRVSVGASEEAIAGDSEGKSTDTISRKVLVRVSEGKYQPYDQDGQALHSVDTFYNSLQRALPDAQRNGIKLPGTWQGGELKVKLQEHALGRDELGVLLKMRRESRPFFLPPDRMFERLLGYPLSGRGAVGGVKGLTPSLKERLRDLYPETGAEFERRFFDIHGENALREIRDLERELYELNTIMNTWIHSPINDRSFDSSNLTHLQRRTLRARNFVKDRLIDAWRRKGPRDSNVSEVFTGTALNFLDRQNLLNFELGELAPILESLPSMPARFDHVTSLDLGGYGLSDSINGFLSEFRNLRLLNLPANRLTALPAAVGQMTRLEAFGLASNDIVLTAQSVADIRGLTQLRILHLDDNPLGMSLDISRMRGLETLTLKNCGLDRWPTGLFAQSRPSGFLLDLQGNSLSQMPEVVPGSNQAGVIARTVVTRELLSAQMLETYRGYRRSVNIDPDRIRPLGGEAVSRQWSDVLAPDDVKKKLAIWDRIENTAGSEPFFNVLAQQQAHFRERSSAFKLDMKTKVWRMLKAMDQSVELRKHIFQIASSPVTCVDAGAQLFNAMGVEVMWHETYQFTKKWIVETEALHLAIGRSRLDELGRISRARVAELEATGRRHPRYNGNGRRVPNVDVNGTVLKDIDEVGIYLKYTTRLANNLELPWQSPETFFSEDDVTEEMLGGAALRVRALEQGEGLRNNLLQQPKWVEYVKGSHLAQFEEINAKGEALENYRQAQYDFAQGKTLTPEAQESLIRRINEAAKVLRKRPDTVVPGQVMSDVDYNATYRLLDVETRRLLERFTDELLGKRSSTSTDKL
ncbi:DUF6543 domain-containing protein [Pseudomonas sp. SIMBA_077]